MTRADAIRLKEELQKIRSLLQDAADDAVLAMAGADLALRDEEMRKALAEHVLGYLVHLDLAIESLQRTRGRLLQSHWHILAHAN
ncbi:MAG: hypothetical protein V1918_09130 [Planctomycetota bacterium]